MIICLDFDKTYTADPALFDLFISSAKARGHCVICCTMRYESVEGDEVKAALLGKVDQIIFTSRIAKKRFLDANDISVDVWIDDSPGWIFSDGA